MNKNTMLSVMLRKFLAVEQIESLCIVMPYYNNAPMLQEHQREWAKYRPDIARRLTVIVVDDGSQEMPAANVVQPAEGYELQLYRILIDKKWNQLGARNLGMHVAQEGWCLMTDIDHVLTAENAERLFASYLKQGSYYIPGRVLSPNDKPYHPHPNSYIMERSLYWRAGGSNEDFVGCYGSDSITRKRFEMFGKRRTLKNVKLRCYNIGGEDIGGISGSGTQLGRKGSEWSIKNIPELAGRRKIAYLEEPKDHLRFPWERVI